MPNFDVAGVRQDISEWAAQISFGAFGVPFQFMTNEPSVMPALIERLPPGWKPTTRRAAEVYSLKVASRSARRYSLFRDDLLCLQASRLVQVLDDFERKVHDHIAEMSPRRVFVHAGVVGWRGKAIMIPGRSFSGKTTLVKELLRLGATYYSDEYAVLDRRGRVYPFARPLSVRRRGSYTQTRVSAASLGATTGEKPLQVGLIAISHFREGAEWRPRLLTKGQGALEVLNHTLPARRFPEKVMTVIGETVARATILKGSRGEGKETARRLLDYSEQV